MKVIETNIEDLIKEKLLSKEELENEKKSLEKKIEDINYNLQKIHTINLYNRLTPEKKEQWLCFEKYKQQIKESTTNNYCCMILDLDGKYIYNGKNYRIITHYNQDYFLSMYPDNVPHCVYHY